MSNIVTVGKISVETFEDDQHPPRLTIGRVAMTLTPLTARLLFDELATIREALVAAHTVLAGTGAEAMSSKDMARGIGVVTPHEVTLARLLVELEIEPPSAKEGS